MSKILPSLDELRVTMTPDVALLENVLRVTIIYLALYFFLRFVYRRESSQVGITNLLVIVLLADGVQNGMTGEYNSVVNALTVAFTLIFWSYTLDYLDFRFPLLQRLIKPAPLLLIKDGKVIRKAMRLEMLTRDEIMSQLRLQGVEGIEDVREAYVEPSGEISVVPREESGGSGGERKKRRAGGL